MKSNNSFLLNASQRVLIHKYQANNIPLKARVQSISICRSDYRKCLIWTSLWVQMYTMNSSKFPTIPLCWNLSQLLQVCSFFNVVKGYTLANNNQIRVRRKRFVFQQNTIFHLHLCARIWLLIFLEADQCQHW